jgi:hypothetical protein
VAFLAYFFVLLAIATSVLFGLDWANAPLHPPASQERAQATAPETRSKAVQQRTRPPSASVPLGRTQPAPEIRAKAETVGQQPPPETSAPAVKVPSAVKANQTPANPPLPPLEPAVAAAPAAAPVAEKKAEPVAQQDPPAASSTSERALAGETQQATKQKADAERDLRREAKRKAERRRAARERANRSAEPVPEWALRGADSARREAKQGGRPGAPAWAYESAEAARREAGRNAQAREPFRPFWESQGGWHFPW